MHADEAGAVTLALSAGSAGDAAGGSSRGAWRARIWFVLAGAGMALAAVLRLSGLRAKSLWFDETFSALIAAQPLRYLFQAVALNDAHPPLYYLLLHLWTRIAGDGEVALRLLAVPAGIGAVAATWGFGRRVVGPAGAAIGALLVAIAPSQVATSQEARMYAPVTLLALLSWWALWTALGGGRRWAWIGYVAATAAMIYTHYYGAFVVAAQAGYLAWRRGGPQEWKRWGAAVAAVLVLFLPWVPSLATQVAMGRGWPEFRLAPHPGLLVDTLASVSLGQPLLDPAAEHVVPGPLAWAWLAMFVGLLPAGVRAARATGAGALVLHAAVLPLAVAFGISYRVHIFAPRYMVFIFPPLALLAGAGVAALGAALRPRARGLVAVVLVVLLLPVAAELRAFRGRPRLDVFDWRKVSAVLASAARSDDALVFLPGFARIPVGYYFRGPQPRLALSPRGGEVVGPGLEGSAAVARALATRPRIWIITVPPVPSAMGTLIRALATESFALTTQTRVNAAILLLLERR